MGFGVCLWHGGQHRPAAFQVGCDAEERATLVLGVGVEVVELHDGLGVASLKGGIADAPVKGNRWKRSCTRCRPT